MPQWRKLYVKATESLDINDMPDDFTRLLWVMLPLGLDSAGRGLDNPSWVKAKVMPLRIDVALDQVADAMRWFAERGMIVRYQVDRRAYFYVPTFGRYQDARRESPPQFPEPPTQKHKLTPDSLQQDSGVTPESLPTHSGVTPDLLQQDSALEGEGDIDGEGDVEEREREMHAAAQRLPLARHQSITIYVQETGHAPPQSYIPDIVRAIGDEPDSITRWQSTVHAWMGCGWKPGNITGMLDYFRRNEIPETRRDNGNSSQRGNRQTDPGRTPDPDRGGFTDAWQRYKQRQSAGDNAAAPGLAGVQHISPDVDNSQATGDGIL
jgi:hypothetical protein